MSWRIQGIINGFNKAAALVTGTRLVGQLIHLNPAGEATFTTSSVFFPLTEKLDATVDQIGCAQVSGVAKVYVETFTGIVAGSPLKAGATGLGVALGTTGTVILGHALEAPTANGVFIPVLLSKSILA